MENVFIKKVIAIIVIIMITINYLTTGQEDAIIIDCL